MVLIIEHNYTKLKLGRVRIYQLNTFKTFTDDENAIYNDKKKKNTELLEAIHNNESVRTVSDKYLNERNEIVIFENDIVRLALADRGYKKCDYQLLDEIIYMVINHNEILWQIIDKGIIIGGKKYKLFTATTGQVRNCKVTLIKEEFYEAHKSFLMAGLTVDGINADKGNDNKGMNVGKYLSYNALLLSSSKLPPKNIDIDKCIVVDGLKTVVNGKVKYIDIKTDDNGQCYVNDTPKEYQTKRISIEHTDGAGMFIPGELPSSCQIRGGYIKGAMFPFDFRLFAHEVSHNSILVDPLGTPHDVEKEDIRYILTTSQLKMWKQYSSWEEYKKKFKENNLKLSINAYAEPPKEEVTFSYQFLQTLPYNTDITELCQPAIEDLRKLKTDLEYVKKELGLTIDDILNEEIVGDNDVVALAADGEKVENANYYIAKALDIYPPLIQDKYIMSKIHSLYNARKNSYKGGKIPVKGYYSYVAPDMYAFCEYLFMGNVNPQGLVPENHVYNKYYGEQGDVEEVLCLRSPHLSRYECPRRKLIVSDKCKKWFKYMESDTVVSCHDMISLFLMCDWDGDHILVVADKAVLKATEGLPDVPLYYDMQKAKAQQIDNESIYKTLVDGFKNNIIGLSSNAITKLWNRPDLEDNPLKYDDAINVICAMSNYAIDFPKTGKNLLIGEYEQLYKELIPNPKNMFKPSNIKYPQFFKFAKGKKSSSLEVYTNSPMDRIPQYIDIEVGRKHFMYDVGTDEDNKKNKFDYKNLMNNSYVLDYKGVKQPLYEPDRYSDEYIKAYAVWNNRKKAKQKLCQDIKKEMDRRNTDSRDITAKFEVFHYHCIREIKDIFTKNGEFNINLAVNSIIDMEYNKNEFKTSTKDMLWKCFGHVIVDNLNQNQKTGIVIKERARMCYKKAVEGDDTLDNILENKLSRKSVNITQADMTFMDAVLQKKKNGTYYQNDRELLFTLLCHYKYAKQTDRLKGNSFFITKYKHKTEIKPNGKKKRTPIYYNMNTIMKMVGAASFDSSFKRFNKSGSIHIEDDKQKQRFVLNMDISDDNNVLFEVQDIYNPLVYLEAFESNGRKKLCECVICGRHFIKVGNTKTCSQKCSDSLKKLNEGKQDKDKKEPAA